MSALIKKEYYVSVCNDGSYIKDQACKLCQGQCKDQAPCNKLTGRCDNGCDDYWTGEFCQG